MINLHRINSLTELYKHVIDCELHQTKSLKKICWYSGKLACRSWLMYSHLRERVLRQCGYLQGILKDPTLIVPPTVFSKDIDGIFVEYHENLIPLNVSCVVAASLWSTIYHYIFPTSPLIFLFPNITLIRSHIFYVENIFSTKFFRVYQQIATHS